LWLLDFLLAKTLCLSTDFHATIGNQWRPAVTEPLQSGLPAPLVGSIAHRLSQTAAMATGWLRGIIKEVPSADTLVIIGAVKSGIPPEKRITLSSLQAPRLVRALRDGGPSWSAASSSPRRSEPEQAEPAPTWGLLLAASALQGRRDGSSGDEPFAWEAKEFLRKKCIGQVRGRGSASG
jgi:hypothetical protein